MWGKDRKIALKNGDPEAFSELFRMIYPRMKGYCRLFIHEENQVEDLIQECFLTLWEKRREIDPDKAVESLMFVMLRNRCFNYLKESRMKEGTIPAARVEVNELQVLYQLDFLEKEEKSLEEELAVAFHQAVDGLPPRMKELFILCKVEGRKQKEVADEMGITVKAVEKQIAAAKERISADLSRRFPAMALLITLLLR